MRGSEFVFDSVDLLHYNFHKISLNRGGSFIDSPEWFKNKKAAINSKNNDPFLINITGRRQIFHHIKD